MRFSFRFLVIATAALLAAACSKDPAGDPETPPSGDSVLKASPAEFDFTAEGGSQTIVIEASAQWKISGAEWCYALVSAGVKGSTTTKIYAEPYNGSSDRSAVLHLTSTGMADVEITVRQAGLQADPTVVVAQPDAWDGKRRGETVYQLLVYSFADSDGDGTGDFRGIIDKMDYIADLGAAAIWLSPIHPSDSYHGYDVTDYMAVNPKFGSEADFKALVDEAHARGIKIYLDYVINHTGKGHPWYIDAYSSTDSEHRDWYMFSNDPDNEVRSGKFPMLGTNPSSINGAWVDVPVTSGADEAVRYKFSLDWSNASAPTITVTETDEPVSATNTDTSVERYLYYGDGVNTRFHAKGDNKYELVVDYLSSWGFLIRTSASSWENNTKWGAPSKSAKLTLGVPFTLNSSTAADILFSDMETWKVYSACYTEWMPDINYGAIASFRESGPYKAVVESVKKWIDMGIDGLRLDMAKHIYANPDNSDNPTFWSGFYEDVNDYFLSSGHTEDIYMVAEVYSGTSQVLNYTNCNLSCFNFDFWGWDGQSGLSYAVKNSRGRYIASDLLDMQKRLTSRNSDYLDATILANHDMNRTAEAFSGNVDRCRMAGVILQTLTGRPYIYYGEELAYRGTKNNGDEFVRAPMAWGDSYTTRYADKNWPSTATVAEMEGNPESILNAYRTFCNLRNIYPALTEKGSMSVCSAIYEGQGTKLDAIGAWYREAEGQRLLVLHNVGASTLSFDIPDEPESAVAVMGTVKREGSTVTMPKCSSVVFKLK